MIRIRFPEFYFFVFVAVLLLNTDPIAAQQTFWVATSGDDNNSGTEQSPFLTIKHGIEQMIPGDILMIKDGVYPESIYFDDDEGCAGCGLDLNHINWSNVNSPFTIKAENALGTIIKPPSAINGKEVERVLYFGEYNDVGVNNIILDGIVLDGIDFGHYTDHECPEGTVQIPVGDGMKIRQEAHTITFQNGEIKNIFSHGVLISDELSTDNHFNNLLVHDNGLGIRPDCKGLNHGFYLQSPENIVENCIIYNNLGIGVRMNIGTNGIIRNNKIYENDNEGIIILDGVDCTIHNNIIWRNGNNIVLGKSGGVSADPDNTRVYQNVIYDSKTFGLRIKTGATNSKIYNNIIYKNGYNTGGGPGNPPYGRGISILEGGDNTDIQNNFISGNVEIDFTDSANNTNINGNIGIDENLDPLFVDEVLRDFNLLACSPAVNSGLDLTTIDPQILTLLSVTQLTDFKNVLRPQSTAYDMGAYEIDPWGPSNLQASNIANNTATISWDPAGGASVNYRYAYRPKLKQNSSWDLVVTTGDLNADLSNLASGTTYIWGVRGLCDATLETDFIDGPEFSTTGPPACADPQNLQISNLTSTSVDLSWDPATGAVNYRIAIRPVNTSTWEILDSNLTTSDYTATGLTPGILYEWAVRTLCSNNLMSELIYGPDFITTDCEDPTNLQVTNITDTTALVSWDPVNTTVTNYRLAYRFKDLGGPWIEILEFPETSRIVTGLTPGTDYEWHVRVLCPIENSELIEGPSFTTSGTSPCGDPQNLQTSNETATSADFDWDDVTEVVNYRIAIRPVNTAPWEILDDTLTTSEYTANGLTPGTTYEWAVRTLCAGSASSDLIWGSDFMTSASSQFADDLNSFKPGNAELEKPPNEDPLILYPNPFDNRINLNVSSSKGGMLSFKFYNVLGKMVHSEDAYLKKGSNQLELDVSILDSGVYYLRHYNDGERKSFKVVKK